MFDNSSDDYIDRLVSDEDRHSVYADDYYMCLGVPVSASHTDICAAYRRLSRYFHPDKHARSADRLQRAQISFERLKRAYSVLSDTRARYAYDRCRECRHASSSDMCVVPRARLPREVYEEYERLAMEKRERFLQRLTNAKTCMSLHVNASEFFANNFASQIHDQFLSDDSIGLSSIEISGLQCTQSVMLPVAVDDTLRLSGQVECSNGVGSGTVCGEWRHLLTAGTWVEAWLVAGTSGACGVRHFVSITPHMNVTSQLVCTSQSAAHLSCTCVYQLDTNLQVQLAYRVLLTAEHLQRAELVIGDNTVSSIVATLAYVCTPSLSTHTSITLGVPHSHVSFVCVWRKGRQDFEASSDDEREAVSTRSLTDGMYRMLVRAGTSGVLLQLELEHRWSRLSSLAWRLAVGWPFGLTLRCRLTRASQVFEVTSRLSEHAQPLLPSTLFYSALVPALVSGVLRRWLAGRAKARADGASQCSAGGRSHTPCEQSAEVGDNGAKAGWRLIQEDMGTERLNKSRENIDGLVIRMAWYGKFDDSLMQGDSCGDEDELLKHITDGDSINVTNALQCYVHNSNLYLPPGPKHQLLGFYDPCPDCATKRLLIVYVYNGRLLRYIGDDVDELRLPDDR